MLRFFLLLTGFVIQFSPFAAHATQCSKEIDYGRASWYGQKFDGRKTASGEIFDSRQLSAAHPTLPFGSHLKVVNPSNNKSVIVTVNDRGDFLPHRIIDISEAAAEQIEIKSKGISDVFVYFCNP
jgi:rare lipoprotein A